MIAAATQHGHSKLTAKSSHLCSLASNSSKTLRPVGNGSSKIEGGSSQGSVAKCLITLNNLNTDFQTESKAARQIYTSGTFECVQRKHRGPSSAAVLDQPDHDKDMWHSLFEEQNPDGHQDFLEYLGIDPMEIRQIRTYSKKVLSEDTNRSVQKSGPKKT